MLIIGPNATFLDYIGQVLPSLGETGVLLSTIGDPLPRRQSHPHGLVGRAGEIKALARDTSRCLRNAVRRTARNFPTPRSSCGSRAIRLAHWILQVGHQHAVGPACVASPAQPGPADLPRRGHRRADRTVCGHGRSQPHRRSESALARRCRRHSRRDAVRSRYSTCHRQVLAGALAPGGAGRSACVAAQAGFGRTEAVRRRTRGAAPARRFRGIPARPTHRCSTSLPPNCWASTDAEDRERSRRSPGATRSRMRRKRSTFSPAPRHRISRTRSIPKS